MAEYDVSRTKDQVEGPLTQEPTLTLDGLESTS